jgi:DNA polymerase III delta prime subunit
MDSLFTLIALLIALAIGAGMGWIVSRRRQSARANETISHVSLEGMRAIGELSVFKAITKEIVTETDYSFGEFGRKYLRWAFSQKKLAMIFEFQIDFRYDLRSPQFEIMQSDERMLIKLPPVKAEISVRSLRFYDEQRSKLMPWLLPDLLNGAFGPGFSEDDKNRLLDGACAHAKSHAHQLIEQLRAEVEASARATLTPLANSFGAKIPQLVFRENVIEVDRTNELRQGL